MTLPPAAVQALRSMPWVSIGRATMRERGRYYHEHHTALIRRGLRGPSYFAALMHELVHAERGDTPCADPVGEAQQELLVAKETSRRLVDIRDLAREAVAYEPDWHRVAEELHVDFDVLTLRMTYLHPAERHYLRRQIARRDGEGIT